MNLPFNLRPQAGALPYRWDGETLFVLLITSRRRNRWIIPKGNLEVDLTPREVAVLEAYEEAGIRGAAADESLGSYINAGGAGPTVVQVFMMEVQEILPSWPEAAFRKRHWFTPEEAIDRVQEHGLKKLLRRSIERLSWNGSS